MAAREQRDLFFHAGSDEGRHHPVGFGGPGPRDCRQLGRHEVREGLEHAGAYGDRRTALLLRRGTRRAHVWTTVSARMMAHPIETTSDRPAAGPHPGWSAARRSGLA
ncbi:MAG: hypothetical protein ACK559_30600, partial [bacterium]